MAEPLSVPAPAWRSRVAHANLAVVAVVAGITFLTEPQYRALVKYGLYAIPAHLLISFLPHEPYLFYVAKLYPPQLIASVGTASCIAAIVLDYWLIGWFVNRGLVRSRLDQWRPYQIAERWFRKAPFLLIFGSALAPVPFYPVKILAISSGYSLALFIVALVLGRWPRFYLLAVGGQKVQAPNSWLRWIAIALALLAIYQIWRTRRKSRLLE